MMTSNDTSTDQNSQTPASDDAARSDRQDDHRDFTKKPMRSTLFCVWIALVGMSLIFNCMTSFITKLAQ